MSIRFFHPLLLAAVWLTPFTAIASQPFSETAFADAQAQGKPILVDISAPWCPTCTKQKAAIQSLEIDYPNLFVFDVDFDSSKDILKRFHVQTQSTLIVFKGNAEVGRSTGQTNPQIIRALTEKGF